VSKFIDVVTTEQVHDDCHQNVTEPSATEYYTKSTNTCTKQELWAKQFSEAVHQVHYTWSYTLYMDVLDTGSTSCALQDTWEMM